MKTYIVLDESGAMHLKDERYFVIAGFITRELHKVLSIHKTLEEKVKKYRGIPINKKVELKASKISNYHQILFINELNSIPNIIPIAIIIDKHNLNKFKASENLAYNFFVKLLIKYLIQIKSPIMKTDYFELRLDNRNNSVNSMKDLETFLTWEFNEYNLTFDVKFLNSKGNREIQMADYIANILWQRYNLPNREGLEQRIIYFKKFIISKFPIKLFGINPPLRKIE